MGGASPRRRRIPCHAVRLGSAQEAGSLTERMWRPRALQPSYDVVIIGAGIHGLATAYYLGKRHGVKKIALLDKGYLGSGNSGRNTAILRSNYRTAEGIPFYDASVKLYEQMSQELGWNVLFSQCGHLTLAHTDSSMIGLRVRAENNQVLGVDSKLIYPDEIKRPVPDYGRAVPSAGRRYPSRCGGVGLRSRLRSHGYRNPSIYRSNRHPCGKVARSQRLHYAW